MAEMILFDMVLPLGMNHRYQLASRPDCVTDTD